MTNDELKAAIENEYKTADKPADRIKALELLCKVSGLIAHGNQEKKDFREVVIGPHKARGEFRKVPEASDE